MNAAQVSLALDAHRAALLRCRRCRLESGIRPVVSGARNARVMLIGQAPGKVESEGGVPFSGRAGRTLFRWLERAGLDEDTAREKIYIAAVTRCYPGAHPSGRGDRIPARDEQAKCGDWLEGELRIIQPSLLIPVGRLAIERFLPSLPLNELIGTRQVVEHSGGRSIAIPLPHPSGASSWIHEPGNRILLDKAINLIASALRPAIQG
jgi:uracil-DNA glycosylase